MRSWRVEIPLFLAIFLDLMGFGMIIVDIQLRIEGLAPKGNAGPIIGAILASTFIVQTLVTPLWGRLSDRIGRKLIVLTCTLISAAAMFVYGGATSIWWILASRILAGLSAANVAVAQALVADAYEAKLRTVAMGRISAAITSGLVLGSASGGIILHHFSSSMLGYIAGSLSLAGAVFMAIFLPNPKPIVVKEQVKRKMFRPQLLIDFPLLRPLAMIAVVAWFSLATLEGTFARLISKLYGYDQQHFGFLFAYESLLGAIISAFLMAWLTRRFREGVLLRWAYGLQGIGLALNPAAVLTMGLVSPLVVLVIASTLYALGSGAANPTINGMCSRLCPDDRQGELFGLLQGTRSFGFVVGPMLGGFLFDRWAPLPYLFAGCVCLAAALLVPKPSLSPAV